MSVIFYSLTFSQGQVALQSLNRDQHLPGETLYQLSESYGLPTVCLSRVNPLVDVETGIDLCAHEAV